MLEFNRVFLVGNLTHDPETRYLPSGIAVCKLRIAANRRFQDTKTGERREEVLYINVEAWGKSAELCQSYLQKGRRVLVEGGLRMNAYQAKDGTNRSEILIRADRVNFLDSRGTPDAGGSAQSGYSQSDPGYPEGAPPPARSIQSPPPPANYAYRPSQTPPVPDNRTAPPAAESHPWQDSRNAPRQFGNAHDPDSVAPALDNGDSAPDFNDNSGGTDNDLPF